MYRSEQKFVVDENTLQVMHHKLSGMLDYDKIKKVILTESVVCILILIHGNHIGRMMQGLKNERNIE